MAATLPAETATRRDAGLVRGIGTWALAANVINGVVGAGIFTLPATVALEVGRAAPLAYLVCAAVMGGVVICFAEAGSRVPTSGGVYGTVEAAFGPATGFVAGMLLLVSDVLASGGIASLLADTMGALVPALAAGAGRVATVLAIFTVLAATNLVDVRTTARLISAATAIKLLPLLFFLVLGADWIGHAPPPGPAATPVTAEGFGRALILTLFAMCGMETPLSASGEVHAAHRTLPRALFAGMLAVVVLYVGIQLTAQHLLGATLAASHTPLADAAGLIGPVPRAIMLAGAGVSALAWMASDVLGTSRLLFAFGRDGRLPSWLGSLGATTQIPAYAVLLYIAAATTLAITGSFLELVILSALTVVAIYSLACAAAVVLQRRGVATAGPPLNLRATPWAACVGLAGMAAMLLSAHRAELLGLIGVICLSLLWFHLSQSRRRV